MSREDYRPCPVEGCETVILPGLLMCRMHWYRVPQALRAEVKEAWAEFRLCGIHDIRRIGALARYNLAAEAAVAAAAIPAKLTTTSEEARS